MSNSEQTQQPQEVIQQQQQGVIIVNQRMYLEALAKPMHDDEIEWKVQTVTNGRNGLNTLVVPYVTSRAIMARLDDVFGLCWQDEYTVLELGGKFGMQCTILITDPDTGRVITKRSDAAELTNIEAIKGGYSDSLKRAAVKFGIGRFLYELPQQWVQISEKRINGQKCEYISSYYKVGDSKRFIKGYYVRPSVATILGTNQQPKSNNNPQNNGGPQGNGNNQPQQTQSNQQKHTKFTSTKGKDITPQDYENSVVNVEKLFAFFNYGAEHIAPVMNHITGIGLSNLRDADFPILQKLFNAMNPIKVLIERSYSLSLKENEILQVVSQYMNEQVVKVSYLFGKLSVQDVQQLLINMQDYAANNLRQQFA